MGRWYGDVRAVLRRAINRGLYSQTSGTGKQATDLKQVWKLYFSVNLIYLKSKNVHNRSSFINFHIAVVLKCLFSNQKSEKLVITNLIRSASFKDAILNFLGLHLGFRFMINYLLSLMVN